MIVIKIKYNKPCFAVVNVMSASSNEMVKIEKHICSCKIILVGRVKRLFSENSEISKICKSTD